MEGRALGGQVGARPGKTVVLRQGVLSTNGKQGNLPSGKKGENHLRVSAKEKGTEVDFPKGPEKRVKES